MREVEFTVDFANKSKGDKGKYDSMLASQLVRVDKVAKFVTKTEPNKTKTKK